MVAQTITLDGTSYSLTFQDEFIGTKVDAWTGHGSDGHWNTSFSPHEDDSRFIDANGEGQYFVDVDDPELDPTITQQGGVLSITAQQLIADDQEYASGVLTTELTFGAAGGYIEMSAKVPDQQGFLAALWLLPADGDWLSAIDVFEILGHDTETVHTNVWENGVGDSAAIATTDVSDGFHTYGLHWTDTEITWFIDDVEVRSDAMAITEEMYLAVSLAVDTTWTGAPDATTDFSDAFEIDYIRVYEETAEPTRNPAIPGDNSFTPGKVYGGTSADKDLYGSRWDDVINGADGADTLYGRMGDDMLSGGNGADSL
ncbi:MAG: family 16 glycosylhydrolase [Rhodobacteraceae bacterium]|nr:family 16 glycosylhydrolase [Paracoccaceae bacterium]